MAAWTVDSNKASYGNFNKYIVDKIKAAASMAAQERKARKELDPDVKTSKGYYFGKALSSQFGGDLIRRTKGTFSSDPSSTEDPSLTKKQRFSNLIGADIASVQPAKQLELPLDVPVDKNAVPVEDKSLKSWLSTMIIGIEKSNKEIADRISGLLGQEKTEVTVQEDQNKSFAALFSSIKTLKNYFNKDNKLNEIENQLEEQQLELILDAKDNAEMAARESNLESTSDVSSLIDSNKVSKPEKSKGGSGWGSLFDFADMFDFDMPGKRRGSRRGSRRRLARRRLNNFRRGFGGGRGGFGRGLGGLGRGLKGLGGRVLGPILGDMIFPEGAGVSEPQMGPSGGFTYPDGSPAPRRKLSEGGFATPETSKIKSADSKSISNASKEIKQTRKKLSEGGVFGRRNPPKLAEGAFNTGVYDNPTTGVLQPGQSVIPLNRNNPVASIFKQMKQSEPAGESKKGGIGLADPLAKIIQLPTVAAGGLMISTLSKVIQKMGGMSRFIFPVIEKTLKPIARVFGLPPSIVSSVFSGVSNLQSEKSLVDFLTSGLGVGGKGGKRKSRSTPPPPPPPPPGGGSFGPGMTATGGSKASGNITSGFGYQAWRGREHKGIDIAGGAWQEGTPISVIKPGVVEQAEDLGSQGWGRYVVIKHDDGSVSLYGHLSQINVRKGQKIENKAGAATVIGKVGSTGAVTGPHLHFELGNKWTGGVVDGLVDPTPYVDNYIRGGGDVKIDAPQVTAPAQQPAQPATSPGSLSPSGMLQTVRSGLNFLDNLGPTKQIRNLLDLISAVPTPASTTIVAPSSGGVENHSSLALGNSNSPYYGNPAFG